MHPTSSRPYNYNQANSYADPYRQVKHQGDNLEAIILEQISSAKQSIDIAVETLSLPLIAQALVERQKAGVKIRWITENTYVKPWGSLTIDDVLSLNSEEQSIWAEYGSVIDANEDTILSPEEVAGREVYTLFKNNAIPWIDDTGSDGFCRAIINLACSHS